MTGPLPLLHGALDGPFAWGAAGPVTRRQFLADVLAAAATLPDRRHVVNLCEDRYLFTVAFAAALVRGHTTLLPPNRTPQLVNEIARGYDDVCCLSDVPVPGIGIPLHRVVAGATGTAAAVPTIPADHRAAVLFTSGSTGEPRPHEKRWGEFLAGARTTASRLGLERAPIHLLATVPPQHMFGLETSVILPLAGMACVDARRPLFPDDARTALAALPAPRALITTPFHLRAFTEAGIAWPAIDFVLSATAPLTAALASRAEQALHTRVLEIYGSTETGALATRRTGDGDPWRLLDGFSLRCAADGGCIAAAPHLRAPVTLNDLIEPAGDRGFRLLGRQGDIISVAGKRGSLGDLTHRLNAIEGVRDGVFFNPQEDGEHIARLAALVVAPDLTEEQILAALRRSIDPAFLPRPLVKVERLPRTPAGKLPRLALLELLRQRSGAP